ncbi:MAG: hypothetical protein Q9175_008098 [Cornicularia normoerica]
MDSIRTELSRLEAMINSASVTHLSEIETGNSYKRRGSNFTERRDSAVEEGKNPGPDMSVSGPLPEHRGESPTARDSGSKFAPQQHTLNETRKDFDRRSQSPRTRELAVDRSIQLDYHKSSADHRSFLIEPDDINDPYMESPAEEGNRSSFLYAEYSKSSQPRQHEYPKVEIDSGAIHSIIRQSLTNIYPPEVVEYVSLRQITTLCEDHIDLLDRRPSVQLSAIRKMKELSYVDSDTPASARPSIIKLRGRLIELRNAIKVSREQCIHAGYSLSELDKLLSPPGSGRRAPADRPPPKLKPDSGDDSSSIYSEDFYSSAE